MIWSRYSGNGEIRIGTLDLELELERIKLEWVDMGWGYNLHEE